MPAEHSGPHGEVRSDVDWVTCAEDGCVGVQLPSGGRCWAHADGHDLEAALERLRDHGQLDARGVTFTAELLHRVLDASHDGEGPATVRHAKFDRTTFEGGAQFDGATFEGNARFKEVKFAGNSSFVEATFAGDVAFDGTTFEGNAIFEGATLTGVASFNGATFQGDTRFNGSTFQGDTWFSEATFQGDSEFHDVTFKGDTRFVAVTFEGGGEFSRATFEGNTWFHGVTYRWWAEFDGATFQAHAGFDEVTFEPNFDGATFQRSASFRGSTFTENTTFSGATFQGNAWFTKATFQGDALFYDVTFPHEVLFNGATFQGNAFFSGATFRGPAVFYRVNFGGGARFDRAKFIDDAESSQVHDNTASPIWKDSATFSGASFTGPARFGGASFTRSATFYDVTFRGHSNFDSASFQGDTVFDGATFHGDTGFDQVTFQGDTTFARATFQGDTGFDGATFMERVGFLDATFERARQLGPMLVRGSLGLDGALFRERIRIEVSSATLFCRQARFLAGVQLRVRWAYVVLDDADLAAPSVISSANAFPGLDEGDWPRVPWVVDSYGTPRLLSLSGADVAGVTVAGVDLRACRFVGAHHLDQLRAEGSSFAETPPDWRWTTRRIIAEEQKWRTWYGPEAPDWLEAKTLGPAQIAPLYRDLRKGLEDNKDEPGAADFYYGEMEMRRHAKRRQIHVEQLSAEAPNSRFDVSAASEWVILTLYWLVSGYGLRAWRALASLAAVVLIASSIFAFWGFHTTAGWDELPSALLFSTQATTALLRGPDSRALTTLGEWLHIALRLIGPVLLGLALLSVRGRVKR
jgi:uncharacterized protein YjbI with pentapeptide repeats